MVRYLAASCGFTDPHLWSSESVEGNGDPQFKRSNTTHHGGTRTHEPESNERSQDPTNDPASHERGPTTRRAQQTRSKERPPRNPPGYSSRSFLSLPRVGWRDPLSGNSPPDWTGHFWVSWWPAAIGGGACRRLGAPPPREALLPSPVSTGETFFFDGAELELK